MTKIVTACAVAALLLLSCSDENKSPSRAPVVLQTEKSDIEAIRERINANPKDAEAWYHLADLYERAGLYREEADALRKVIAIHPEKGYTHLKLGNTYNRLKQYKQAVTEFRKAMKHLPGDPVLYNNLAFSYSALGNREQQIQMLKKAISLRPRYATARFNLGVALLKKGQLNEALYQYQELNKFDEGTAIALKKQIDAKRK